MDRHWDRRKKARGKGLGFAVMKCLENQIKLVGGSRVELGVFSFNKPAITLYEKLGYKKFDTAHEFTWWNGKRHANYQYEKYL